MKVALSTPGKFHTFDLARELHARDALECVFTGYPRFKLKDAGLPPEKIRPFPWLITPYLAMLQKQRLPRQIARNWANLNNTTLDWYTSRNLPTCEVFVGMSSAALHTGITAQQIGAKYVCDRGSTHIRHQDIVLAEEHAIWGQSYSPIDPRTVAREEAEYHRADCITVPSDFTRQTFLDQGIAAEKIKVLPYGVNLQHFQQVGHPDDKFFDVLFAGGASLRKGVPYLLQAFGKLQHPHKRLWFAGSMPPAFVNAMRAVNLWSNDFHVLGHLNREQLRERMSKSHVLVLPSLEEGLALVQAQAMACGCPIIATENTGAPNLFKDGDAGFILPVRRADLIADALQRFADQPGERERMSGNALRTVSQIGGWSAYGDAAIEIYRRLL
ncbi:hypothetical protein DEH84_14190 [Aquabacterium olei]|uniref:Glycosyltransferase family 1 protein n=1 Tax=Aquabacterium olei TaxID=1296669 RepID=A0A2U8FTR8_9BURK|nr:glycosyltransferase [Aquabacterium olei]AWI54445.1 hypothetical protein DEH84_14190 [Aquabacterium olei]